MAYNITPTIGEWYQDRSNNSFEIVAFDSVRGLIEIQFFDGTIEELDLESWHEEMFIVIAPPEDWSGSLDIEKQDYGVDLEESRVFTWANPLDTF